MSAVEGTSVPPPGWSSDQSAIAAPVSPVATPVSAIADAVATVAQPVAQPISAVAEPISPVATPISPVAEPISPVPQALVATGQPAAEAAVRWRVGAAIIDNFLVYAGYIALCLILHWQALTVSHLLVLLGLGVVYHFALESSSGQTLGKRRYGIQVVSVHGGPASRQGIALRSVLRMIDALPFSYLSGLISMVRTGPDRRQRIGDVAGETKVIAVGGRAARQGTPRWVLPTATLLALAVSCLGVYGVAEAGHQPLSSAQEAQFISGCDRSAGGQVIDCQCLLSRLEADGYNTPDSLDALVQKAQNEEFYRQSGPARTELTSDALACHK